MFFNKHAIVIGPTPPGTGVKAFATLETSSNATSPTIPLFVLLIPTSITIVSFFNPISFYKLWHTNCCNNNIGLLNTQLFKSLVFECVIVTVQFSLRSNCVIGFPFKFDLPTDNCFFTT